jgi:hypothetical protein
MFPRAKIIAVIDAVLAPMIYLRDGYAMDADWNEEDHPRQEDGKFGEGGGAGTKTPGFDATFEKGGLPPWLQSKSSVSIDSIDSSPEKVNLFILEVTDLATGQRLLEYEDGE